MMVRVVENESANAYWDVNWQRQERVEPRCEIMRPLSKRREGMQPYEGVKGVQRGSEGSRGQEILSYEVFSPNGMQRARKNAR